MQSLVQAYTALLKYQNISWKSEKKQNCTSELGKPKL